MRNRNRKEEEEKERHVKAVIKRKEEEEAVASMVIYLPLEESALSFDLEKAVCNHGFFMMAPNQWIPSTKTLQRPLRLTDSTTSVVVQISQPKKRSSNHLCVLVLGTNNLSPQDQKMLLAQIARMLRISKEDEWKMQKFHEIHSKAKKKGFGRLFRSPSLFEDMVKTILLCNCGWERSLDMCKALCELSLPLKGSSTNLVPKGEESISKMAERKGVKRKNVNDNEAIDIKYYLQPVSYPNSLEGIRPYRNFPISKDLANLDEKILREDYKLGYRAGPILRIAKAFENGKIKLGKHDDEDNYDTLLKQLKRFKGFGPFTYANVQMCLGLYESIPIDSETVRHLEQFHGKNGCNRKTAQKYTDEIYGKYAPFQCLAYWLELVECYEKKVGKLSQLPHSMYHLVTAKKKMEMNNSSTV